MKKEIEIKLSLYHWNSLFNKINYWKYDYKKFLFKSYLDEWYFNDEKIQLWIIITFKKLDKDIYWKVVFWLNSEKNLSVKTINEIKKLISNYIYSFKKSEFYLKQYWNVKIDEDTFKKTWCWSIEFMLLKELEHHEELTFKNFKSILKKIYNFLYFDVLNNLESKVLNISNPLSEYDENEIEIPYWLKWSLLESEINNSNFLSSTWKVSFDDMWWNRELKLEISKLISFYKNKEHFKRWNIEAPRWVLLYWPPWTWKTLTAKIIASEIWVNFYTLSSDDIITKWIWESAKNVSDFFKRIDYPCIVFMDEIDSLVPKRDVDSSWKELHENTVQIINTLLREIDWFWIKKEILFIWATNRIDSLDPWIMRTWRLDYKIFVDYPDYDARKEIWWIYLKKAKEKTNFDFLDEKVDLDILAKKSDKFTWSDINEIVRRLLNDYAIWSLVSDNVTKIIWWNTTQKWLLYLIDKFKKEKIINHDIFIEKPDIKLSDIWWSKQLKEELSKIINQYKNYEIYDELGVILPRWVLLYWPPWTWKTLAAKALAWEIWEIFYSIKASDILSQWTNASVEKLDNIFKSFETPCIVFIDEIDAIAKDRDKKRNISEEDIKVLNTFLQYIDWFDKKKDILFIWATNRIDSLDKAILRAWRFDTKILVDYPDYEARKEIWWIYIKKSITKQKKLSIFEIDIDYDLLADKSENLTWADISEIVRRLKEDFATSFTKNIDLSSKDFKLNILINTSDIIKQIEKYYDENLIINRSDLKIWFRW